MTGFILNFNDVFEGKIEDGTYEVVITNASENVTPGGTEYIDLQLTIRNDVDQKYKNMIIFEKLWKSKETGKYNIKMFNTIGKAAKLQPGKVYTSLQDLLNDFLYKTVRVTVKNEVSEYNGKTYENLRVKRWEETKFPQVQHQYKTKENMTIGEMQNSGISIDDDLPF